MPKTKPVKISKRMKQVLREIDDVFVFSKTEATEKQYYYICDYMADKLGFVKKEKMEPPKPKAHEKEVITIYR